MPIVPVREGKARREEQGNGTTNQKGHRTKKKVEEQEGEEHTNN